MQPQSAQECPVSARCQTCPSCLSAGVCHNNLYNLLGSTARGRAQLKRFDRKIVRTVTHQGRNGGPLNAENCARFNLCEAATLGDALRSPMARRTGAGCRGFNEFKSFKPFDTRFPRYGPLGHSGNRSLLRTDGIFKLRSGRLSATIRFHPNSGTTTISTDRR